MQVNTYTFKKINFTAKKKTCVVEFMVTKW
jgi:hypothetical protein